MTRSIQKTKELEQLKKAFKLLGIRNYDILGDNESPDFIVSIDGQTIGIEVTELYNDLTDSNSAKTESNLPKIIKKALKIYNDKHGAPFSFGFGFNGNIGVINTKYISTELGECLLEEAKRITNQLFGLYKFIPNKTKYPSLHIIEFIYVQKVDTENADGFVTSTFSSVQVELSALISKIEEKADLLSKYWQRCDIIWLLITLPSMMLSSDLILPETEFTCQYKGFDNIYVLDEYRDKIQSINKQNS